MRLQPRRRFVPVSLAFASGNLCIGFLCVHGLGARNYHARAHAHVRATPVLRGAWHHRLTLVRATWWSLLPVVCYGTGRHGPTHMTHLSTMGPSLPTASANWKSKQTRHLRPTERYGQAAVGCPFGCLHLSEEAPVRQVYARTGTDVYHQSHTRLILHLLCCPLPPLKPKKKNARVFAPTHAYCSCTSKVVCHLRTFGIWTTASPVSS